MRLADSKNRTAAAFVAPLTCKSQRDGPAAFVYMRRKEERRSDGN
jgi:hypothetical protein